MRILLALIALGMVSITPAFAETVIFADFTTYEIAEVVEVRQFKNSPIVKTQGYTTVGGLFFIYESTKTDFTYAMILDRDGQWHKGEIREKTEVVIPEVTDIPPIVEQQENNIETRELLLVGKYTSHTFLKSLIQFDGKIYDKALNPTPSFYSNYGQVEDAIIRISITDSKGNVKWNLNDRTNEFGFFGPSTQIENRFSDIGEYKVTIEVRAGEDTLTRDFPMFVQSSPNSSGTQQQRFVDFNTGQTVTLR